MKSKKLSAGDWVEVRSKEEILSTLDGEGRLDGMPFMPEMFQFCGKKFQVYKRAHKTCDYTTPYPYRTRWLRRSVHLETRCDGEAHRGCQAGCLLIWKEAWLKPVSQGGKPAVQPLVTISPSESSPQPQGCSEDAVWAHTEVPDPKGGPPTFVCQATITPAATTYLRWWDIRQYIEDYTSGNTSLKRVLSALAYSTYYHLSQAGIGLGPVTRWLYNKLRWLWGGPMWPRTPGHLPEGSPTPTASLNLQPGEWVRVKPQEEILKTVTYDNRNRGMFWDAELVPYCGGTYRVLRSVTKLIDEKTARMIEMKTPCIILDSVVCQARYSDCRMLCPKSMYPYWREIWLERVEAPKSAAHPKAEETDSAVLSGGAR